MAITVVTPSLLPERLFETPLVDEDRRITRFWTKFFQSLPINVKVPAVIKDTNANRANFAAANYSDGSLFYETDRLLVYVAIGKNWTYLSGVLQSVQSGLPFNLGVNDLNLPAYIIDFNHLLMWNGQAWQWYPGESGSDFIVPFVSGPDPTRGWHACDGSANVPKLKGDGGTVLVTVPNTPGSWYRQ